MRNGDYKKGNGCAHVSKEGFTEGHDKIKENPHQPRRDFDEIELQSLASSIREHGILQPLIISKFEDENPSGIKVFYELIAGERRLKAAKLAGFQFVPAIIKPKVEDRNKLELALIENIQRADLNAIEKARGYDELMKKFGLSQKETAFKVGQSRESVANTLRLLGLPIEIQKAIESGKISEGHGRAILAVENDNQQLALMNEIISKNPERKEKKLWTQNPAGSPIEVIEAGDEKGEADFIISKIVDLNKNLDIGLDEMVVMYRTNAQSRVLEEACLYANLPYRVIGAVKFYQRKEIKDILAYLRLIQNQNDEMSLKRITSDDVSPCSSAFP